MLDKPLSDGCGRASLRYALPVRTVRRRQHAIGRKDRLERVTVRGCSYYLWTSLALIETALALGELACNQTSTVRLGQVSRYSPLSTTIVACPCTATAYVELGQLRSSGLSTCGQRSRVSLTQNA